MKSGILEKMTVRLDDGVAQYQLDLDSVPVAMNSLVGLQVKITFTHEIFCSHCGTKIKKTFSGGNCFPCSRKLASCDMCILKPELCHFAKGTCREPAWGEANCLIPHIIYLANSSGLKVGITRHNQIPTRWIDQGASSALPIIRVNTRLQSGIVEKIFASEIDDKTDWRKMLRGPPTELDLCEKRDELFHLLGSELDRLDDIVVIDNESSVSIKYPVIEYPETVKSLSLDKTEVVAGKLLGIKGQYLIFDCGVLNIRNHTSYKIQMEF
jgi:hypothetical protein